ncbi:MAG: sigma 54-interacting transcriptional regulator [Deltaproteobacteria bacterium]|jgi:DNA-binding NtrC family response regulator|nr:sigma 54-interacting transcriptional regulator [Deltaproteobacteria bacterium]
MAELVAFREDRLGFRFRLPERAMLGRSAECDLILFDRSASRRHAEITLSGDTYFIEDLNSTNGTLVNDLPISEKLPLKPFDCVKIGQEIYIFEPYLDVITGPAPAALILNAVNESQRHILSIPAIEAASSVSQAQAAYLVELNHALCQAVPETVTKVLLDFLESRLGATSVSILWPGDTGPLNQISFLSFPPDKRLLLGNVPYRSVTEMGHATLWPHIITELFFTSGNRNVEFSDHPCLLVPLYSGGGGRMGLLYLENSNRAFEQSDLVLLSAVAMTVSPFLKNLTLQRQVDDGRRLAVAEPITNLIGRDHQIKVIFSTASHLAQGDKPIFITGELGTGKTSLAKHIHQQSPKRNGRFLELTLSGMSQAQIELALFGQEGGEENIVGLLHLANNGTMFLRHIENLPLSTQRNILMAIEEGLIYPMDSRHSRLVSIRFITSSQSNLQDMVENGTFREDLYFRLTGINLALPPLRETRNDIESLAHHYCARTAKFLGLPFHGLDQSVIECLRAYPWPGNIKELMTECESMAGFSRDGHVVMDCLPVHIRLAAEVFNHGDNVTGDTLLGEAERCYIGKGLSVSNGDTETAAAILGLNPETLIRKIRIYGLDPLDFQAQYTGPTLSRIPGQTNLPSEVD